MRLELAQADAPPNAGVSRRMHLLPRRRRAWRARVFVHAAGLLRSPAWAYGNVQKWPPTTGRSYLPIGGALHLFSSYREAA